MYFWGNKLFYGPLYLRPWFFFIYYAASYIFRTYIPIYKHVRKKKRYIYISGIISLSGKRRHLQLLDTIEQVIILTYLKLPTKLYIISVVNFLFSPQLRDALNCTFQKYQPHYIRNIFPIQLNLIYLCTYINQPCDVTWNLTSNNDIDNFIIYLIMLN